MNQTLDIVNGFFNSPYGALAVIGSVFVVATRRAWTKLVNKLTVNIHNKDVNVSTQQSDLSSKDISNTKEFEKITKVLSQLKINSSEDLEVFLEQMYEELNQQDQKIEAAEKLTKLLLDLKDNYELAYLNLFLVPDSKRAFLLFYESDPMTKDLFMSVFDIPENNEEKELIFNTLLANELVTLGGNSQYEITDKGEKLLRYINYI